MAEDYDWAAIRHLIRDTFNSDDFANFCSDYFREVYRKFAEGQTLSEQIRLLIDHVDTRNQVRDLLEKIRIERPATNAEVRRLLTPSVVTPEQRQTLWDLTSNIPLAPMEWQRLYRASVPQWITSFTPAETLYEALDHLWDLPRQRNNRRPIFEFIERLAAHLKQMRHEGAQALREYTDRTAPLLDRDMRAMDIMRMRDDIEAEVALEQPLSLQSLLIKIVPLSGTTDPQDTRQHQYQVRFALWRDKGNILPLEPDNPNTPHGDAWHPLTHVPLLVDQVLDQLLCARLVRSPEENLIIEFFLPYALLSHDVDQLFVRFDEEMRIKLGCRYRVVVRSLERACDPRSQGYWHSRWQRFQQQCNGAGMDKAVYVCESRPYRWMPFYTELTEASPPITCLGLTFVPVDASQGTSLLRAIIKAGIPVALWPRSLDSTLHKTIISLVSPANIATLPAVLRAHRKQADLEENHVGNHLTLLWDDPERLFPEDDPALTNQLQLQSP